MRKEPVVITGISGNLGRTIARLLHRDGPVIGIDRRPFSDAPKDVAMHQIDVRRRKAGDIFRRADIGALVHLGIVYDPRQPETERHAHNVMGTRQILDYCVRYGVRKVVVLSSANVYGPHPDNPNFLSEDAPLQAAVRHGDIRDLVEVDMYAQSFFWRHPEIETVILRPVHVVGPSVRNTVTRYLRLKRPWQLMGFDPLIQLIHQEDVAQAILAALEPGVRGVFNVAGPGEAPLSRILEILGRRPRYVPSPVARTLVDGLWKARAIEFPAAELDHLQYLAVVDGSAFRDQTGFRPEHGLVETVRSVDGRA